MTILKDASKTFLQKKLLSISVIFLLGIIGGVPSALFAEENSKVKLCHHPPGNDLLRHTIQVDPDAVNTHLKKHGDSRGECQVSRGELIRAKNEVLGSFPRDPNKINFRIQGDQIRRQLKLIARRNLGQFPPIQNLLISWAKHSDFSQPPLFEWYRLYEQAFFTMPDSKVAKLLVEFLPHKIEDFYRRALTNKEDRIKVQNIANVMVKRIKKISRKVKRRVGKQDKTRKKKKRQLIVHHDQLLNSLAGISYMSDTNSRKAFKRILNENINSPKKVLWPYKEPAAGGAYSVENILGLIETLNWSEARTLVEKISNGDLDKKIKELFAGPTKLDELKKQAKKILKDLPNLDSQSKSKSKKKPGKKNRGKAKGR
jgi:hypothetical protein